MAVTLCKKAEPTDPDHVAFEEYADKEFVPLGAPMVAWRSDPDGKFVNYDDPTINAHHKTWNAAVAYVMQLADSRAMDQIHYDWQKVNDVINRMRRFQIVLERRISALRDAIIANTSRRPFKEDGLWFMPDSDKGASGSASQISAPVSQLYEALEATSGDVEDVHTRAVDIRDFSPNTLEKVRRALTLAGCALPPSDEALNAEIERYVSDLVSELIERVESQIN